MTPPLRVLIVEDSEDDALLVVGQLRRGGYDVTWERVETAGAMRAALGRQPWDIVTADYQMPRFSGLAALELLKASGLDLPFIIVSGTIGEDLAVEAMKAGANDYLMKGKLARLVPAVERELRDAVERRERRRAAEALGASEERFAKAFHLSPLSIAISTLSDGVYREVNDSFLRFTGYTREEAIGRTSVDLKLWVDERIRQKIRKQLAAGNELRELPAVLRTRSGALRDVLYSAVTIQLGGVDHVLSLALDITARKRAEEALRNSQAFYHSLVDQLPAGVFRKDREGRYVFVSPWFCRLKGVQPEEFLGKTPAEVAANEAAKPDANEQAIKYVAEGMDHHVLIMQTGNPIEVIEEHTDAAGRKKFLHALKIPVFSSEGKVIGTQGVLSDITALKQAEAHNREQAALLDNANDAIYVTALDCTILYWNRGAERTYGWTSAEVLNRKTTELICPDVAAAEALAAILLQQGSRSGERRQIRKSGGMVEVFSRLTLVRDPQGLPQSVFAIDTDITEKKQLEAQFLRAQRLESIGALASGIAHDLNNVLAPIIMAAPLLQDLVQDPTARYLLKTMETSAQRGADIVKQVLTFARGVEGERVLLQPRHLLRELEKLVAETFPKGIRIESDIAADLWPVLGDATQLHQALMNLCINARDAMPGGGVLTLQAANVGLAQEAAEKIPGAQPGSYACLRVTDTGTGIPPEIEAKIFEPFFTTKGVGKGTGLGLSTVLGIVRSHGGFVRVASKVGQGTTFELYLPATQGVEVEVKRRSAPPWPHAHGEGILVVDDEAAVREVAHQALVELGYHVITAGGGAEAIRIFQARRREIQLVLTDMMMPEMDGLTLVAALRVLDPAVKIVGITGASDPAGVSGLKTMALSAMLAKPFTIEMLLAVIRDALPATAGDDSAVPDRRE
jgi:PAS domain S-box-containing protein